MKANASIIRAVPLVAGIFALLFFFLAFMPPLVPISRINITGCNRIEVKKVEKYLSGKLVMGMIPTVNSQFQDASKELGPILEKMTIRKGFFFQATLEVEEKKDFFVIGYGSDKVKVDVLGNLVEGALPENAKIALNVRYIQPDGKEGMPTASEYEQNLQRFVGAVLRSKATYPATIVELIYNKYDYVTNSNGKKFYLVAPRAFSLSGMLSGIPSAYKRVYLENIYGVYARTAQGSLIVFGDDTNMDVKMGSVSALLEGLKLEAKQFPGVIKADIPYQLTVVQ